MTPRSPYMDEADDMTRSVVPKAQPKEQSAKQETYYLRPPEIWKFNLSVGPVNKISMPQGAILRAVDMQGNDICLWAEVIPEAPRCVRQFKVFGTGWSIEPPDDQTTLQYLETVVTPPRGEFVWHVYEVVGLVGGLETNA